jgi:putative oxidoreductase
MYGINKTQVKTSKIGDVILRLLQILTAAAFLMSGFAKLSGNPLMIETFDKIGIGQWFRFLTGAIEMVSAVLLLVPKFAPVGALLLICTMIGAIFTHVLIIGGSPLAAIVLFLINYIIFWARRERLQSIFNA